MTLARLTSHHIHLVHDWLIREWAQDLIKYKENQFLDLLLL